MRFLHCNPEHVLLWPIRPIAKPFCDAVHLAKYSKLSALCLFLGSCTLLFISYRLSELYDQALRDIVERILFEKLPKQMAIAATKLLCQLVLSNSLFVVFRYVLSKLVYALYELGRNTVFSLLLLSLLVNTTTIAFWFVAQPASVDSFIDAHRYLAGLELGGLALIGWYWQRYYYRSNGGLSVFDHEIGSMLVQLKR